MSGIIADSDEESNTGTTELRRELGNGLALRDDGD